MGTWDSTSVVDITIVVIAAGTTVDTTTAQVHVTTTVGTTTAVVLVTTTTDRPTRLSTTANAVGSTMTTILVNGTGQAQVAVAAAATKQALRTSHAPSRVVRSR